MRSPRARPNGYPNPTIEQLEHMLRQARYQEGETERFISRRARRKLDEAEYAKSKDDRVKKAFKVGYQMGKEDAPPLVTALCAVAMPAAFFGAIMGTVYVAGIFLIQL